MSLMAQCRAKARRYENQNDTEFSHRLPRGRGPESRRGGGRGARTTNCRTTKLLALQSWRQLKYAGKVETPALDQLGAA
jgi:hypothetical protein